MKILNLVDEMKGDVKYKISKFPDGQQNIIIENKVFTYYETKNEIGSSLVFLSNPGISVQIKTRLNNWMDLELICCTVASLRELGVKEIHLYIPYFVGARSDRKFEEGGNNYLKDVICPIINSLGFAKVEVLDAHSNCLEMGIKNFKNQSNTNFIEWALTDLYPNDGMLNNVTFIAPDAGATHKIYKLAQEIEFEGEIITCTKERSVIGGISNIEIPVFDCTKDVIIIDDICDGGKTFINIAKVIEDRWSRCVAPGNLYLIVTHGIFSGGFGELSKCFDGIYCTNSYKDMDGFDYTKELGPIVIGDLVKQLNIF